MNDPNEPMTSPRWTQRLLARAVPADRLDEVLGDLEEVHTRRSRQSQLGAWMLTSIDAVLVSLAFLLYRWRDERWARPRWITLAELRLGARLMRKQPVLTMTSVLALATGMAMAITGFTFLEAIAFSRLPFENGDRFVRLHVYEDQRPGRITLDEETFRLFAQHATAFEHLGAFTGGSFNLALPSGAVAMVGGAYLTPDSWRFVPGVPLHGRTLVPDDAHPGAPPVVLLREVVWRRLFGADPGIIGRSIVVNGVDRTIVGVMPDAARFPNSGELWLPLGREAMAGGDDRPALEFRTFGVLAPGKSEVLAEEQVRALAGQLDSGRPGAKPRRILVREFTHEPMPEFYLMMVAVVAVLVLVLVVMAANVANLILARTFTRSVELAVRSALGATRARLVGQIFCEVILLAGLAAIVGLTASQVFLDWVQVAVEDVPFWIDFTAGPRTLIFVIGATLLCAGVGGALPALRITRRDAALTLAGRATPPGFGRVAMFMVAVQIALSVAFLHAAFVTARGLAEYQAFDVAGAEGRVLAAWVWVEPARLTRVAPSDGSGDPVGQAQAAMVDELRRLPGVVSAGMAAALPQTKSPALMTEIREAGGSTLLQPLPVVSVDEGFFSAIDVAPVAGRAFDQRDVAPDAPPVAIVNQSFAQQYFGGTSPLGQWLRPLEPERITDAPWRQIVGIVPDLAVGGEGDRAAGYYLPARRSGMYVVLRTEGPAVELAHAVRVAVLRADPGIHLGPIRPLADVGSEDRAFFTGLGAALMALGVVALGLSVMGMFAILSLSVSRRTREIGVRLALGASPRDILGSIIGRISVPLAGGSLAGLGLGSVLVMARGMFVLQLPATAGAWGLPLLVALVLAAGLMATWLPARRALAIRPADALRAE